jgi:hypothetical protein
VTLSGAGGCQGGNKEGVVAVALFVMAGVCHEQKAKGKGHFLKIQAVPAIK